MGHGAFGGGSKTRRSGTVSASVTEQIEETLHTLSSTYPHYAAPGLFNLCPPRDHTHPASSDGKWIQRSCPLKSWGKAPHKAGWKDDSGGALDRYARGQWEEGLDAAARHVVELGGNIGWLPPFGILVLDADDKDSMQVLQNQSPKTTPRQRTNAGMHFVFRLPDGATALSRAGHTKTDKVQVAGAAVDLRGDGASFIAAEPSIHRKGTSYQWEVKLPHSLLRIPRLPPAFLKDLVSSGAVSLVGMEEEKDTTLPDAVKAIVPIILATSGMDRHVLINTIVGALVQHMAAKDVRPILVAIGAAADEKELKGARIAKILKSTRTRMGEGRAVPGSKALRGLIGLSAYSAFWRALGLSEGADEEEEKINIGYSGSLPTEKVDFLWPGWLPKGKLGVFDGDPGTGKTTLMCKLAALFSRKGNTLPDGTKVKRALRSLYISMEDDAKDTLNPRYLANGGDPSMFASWHALVLPEDAHKLESVIEEHKIELVFIDPIMAAITADSSMMNDADIRRCLAPLSLLANRTGATIIMIRHLTKDSKNLNLLYRGQGTIAFIGAARFSLFAAQSDTLGEACFGTIKQNLAPKTKTPGWLFTLEENEEPQAAIVRFGASVDDVAGWFRKAASSVQDAVETESELIIAARSLEQVIEECDGKMMVSKEAEDFLKCGFGITKKNLVDRVRKEIGIASVQKKDDSGVRRWWWVLPDVDRTISKVVKMPDPIKRKRTTQKKDDNEGS